MENFKKLKVLHEAKDLAVIMYKLTDTGNFKKDFGFRDQIKRTSVSIPSNIAEGDSLDTDKQSIRHFYIARGSTAELRIQLLISFEVGYITRETFKKLDSDYDNLSAMLTNLIKHGTKNKISH